MDFSWYCTNGFIKAKQKYLKKIGIRNDNPVLTVFDTVVTFFIVTFAWIFFRANTMNDALLIVKNIFDFSGTYAVNLFKFPVDFYIAFISIGLLLLIEVLEEHIQLFETLRFTW